MADQEPEDKLQSGAVLNKLCESVYLTVWVVWHLLFVLVTKRTDSGSFTCVSFFFSLSTDIYSDIYSQYITSLQFIPSL